MNTIESRKATILRNIAAEGRKRAGKRPRALIETFLNAFYANVAIQELSECSAGELASIALANFDNAAQRKPGRTNIRVHNIEDSADTLVEIATDDMPFLIDSASAALARSGAAVALLVHPILRVRRDSAGRLIEIANTGVGSTARAESIVTFAIARQENAAKHNEIADALAHAYADVRAAVEDWPAMREEVQTIIATSNYASPKETPATSPRRRISCNGRTTIILPSWATANTTSRAAARNPRFASIPRRAWESCAIRIAWCSMNCVTWAACPPTFKPSCAAAIR